MLFNMQKFRHKQRRKKESESVFQSLFSCLRFPTIYFNAKAASSVLAELVPTNTLKSPGSLTYFRSLL